MKLGPALAGGSFPAIQNVTGRKARGFSLFMSILRGLVVVLLFAISV